MTIALYEFGQVVVHAATPDRWNDVVRVPTVVLAGTQDAAHRLHTGPVPRGPGHVVAFRPAVVAVHDDGDVARDHRLEQVPRGA